MAQQPVPLQVPRDWTVNGIGKLSIVDMINDRQVPLLENTLEFTGVSFCLHAGLTILEKPQGRAALRQVGELVISQWRSGGSFRFGGDVRQLPAYIDHFIETLRADFPRVYVADQPSPDIIASTTRLTANGAWSGPLEKYKPKFAAALTFNRSKVVNMARASAQGAGNDARARAMSRRYRAYLFMLTVATAHELVHMFIGYLAQGNDAQDSYTPPSVSYLNYGRSRQGRPIAGESGRWFEAALFGGSMEFYRDVGDDNQQAGIPYMLDSNGNATKIDSRCIDALLSNIASFEMFPFGTTGRPLTLDERRRKGLLSLGTTNAQNPAQPNQAQLNLFMIARLETQFYNLSARDLVQIPLRPGYTVRAVRVAAA